jgi:acetylornithine deacetylase/succinyl-diaminopimelate desuccinylase-like protein
LTSAELLQQLIRFDTTNPPGNEAACVGFVRSLLEEAGCETQTYAKDPGRPNLVARLQGPGNSAPRSRKDESTPMEITPGRARQSM